mmetsp:Transcript_1429/g.4327  ORF Transcript_1429/g.4327 Transcript_1429/m.4327 type:complete len:164 (-) Transcript_1429:598-1089(-)
MSKTVESNWDCVRAVVLVAGMINGESSSVIAKISSSCVLGNATMCWFARLTLSDPKLSEIVSPTAKDHSCEVTFLGSFFMLLGSCVDRKLEYFGILRNLRANIKSSQVRIARIFVFRAWIIVIVNEAVQCIIMLFWQHVRHPKVLIRRNITSLESLYIWIAIR